MSNPNGFPRRIDHGMVAAYNWQYGGSCPDLTENGNTGTLVGNAATSEGVLTLDGAGDYVTAPVDISGYSAITLTGWIQFDVIDGGSGDGARLFSVKRSGANDEIIRCGATSSGVLFAVFDPGTTYGAATITAVVGTWYFLSMVWSASGWSMRLDNSEFSSGADSFNLSLAEGTFYIGKNSWTTTQDHDGDIGETRIYNRALTADEITDIYNDMRGDYP